MAHHLPGPIRVIGTCSAGVSPVGLLCPQLRSCRSSTEADAMCQQRTHAPQQTETLFDHLVGGHLQRNGNRQTKFLAVVRLTTSSNLVGWITGNSAGFSPLRIFAV